MFFCCCVCVCENNKQKKVKKTKLDCFIYKMRGKKEVNERGAKFNA